MAYVTFKSLEVHMYDFGGRDYDVMWLSSSGFGQKKWLVQVNN